MRGRRLIGTSRWQALTVPGMLFVLCAATCGPPPPPDLDSAQGRAVDRALNETTVDALDCRAGDCLDWHRIRLVAPGTLRLEARVARSDERASDPSLSLILADGFGERIDGLDDVRSVEQELIRELNPGFYLIGVESPDRAKAMAYELTPRFAETVIEESAPEPTIRKKKTVTPRKPIEPIEPRVRRVDAEVLEVEGQLSAPTAVLLDIGRARGVFQGMSGELMEGDDLVGRIEVLDVYDEGSRARLSSPLLRPITPRVKAILLFPDENGSAPTRRRDLAFDEESDAWFAGQDARKS